MAQRNPIIGGLISGLVGGIPDLVAGIRENKAARKAEKLKSAGMQQMIGGGILAGVVENPTAVLDAVSGLAGNPPLSIPNEVLDLPIGFQIAYMAMIAGGFIIRMVGNSYAKKAAKEATK